mmetsp:Transcript_30652/g.97702  ORF Transcript_30652/g.97702 Transcript_30652/m.97702 type:complete len:242 (-) Transcript_30652:1523-2248(-)
MEWCEMWSLSAAPRSPASAWRCASESDTAAAPSEPLPRRPSMEGLPGVSASTPSASACRAPEAPPPASTSAAEGGAATSGAPRAASTASRCCQRLWFVALRCLRPLPSKTPAKAPKTEARFSSAPRRSAPMPPPPPPAGALASAEPPPAKVPVPRRWLFVDLRRLPPPAPAPASSTSMSRCSSKGCRPPTAQSSSSPECQRQGPFNGGSAPSPSEDSCARFSQASSSSASSSLQASRSLRR